ncbi:MAG: hypothetical protein GVY19_02235 [Bacteroidetes bacterium]|jgi:hypothetical protein|nr:hypothetical protein [Bacteroidota bacterium]
MRNVLVLNDFSDQSKIGITYANAVIKKMGGHLLILEIPRDNILNKADKDLFYSELSLTTQFQLTFLNTRHHFPDDIEKIVNDEDIHLIIMGISREPTNNSMLDVATYENLLSKVNIPVLISANLNGNIILQDIGFILSDINNVSTKEIQRVKELSNFLNAKIHLLYVMGNNEPNRIEVLKALEEIANRNNLTSSTLNVVHNDRLLDGVKSFSSRKNIDIISLSGQNSIWKDKAAEVANEVLENQFCSLYWCKGV